HGELVGSTVPRRCMASGVGVAEQSAPAGRLRMSVHFTGNVAHDAATNKLEVVRQSAAAGATQAATSAAEVTYFRAMIAQCLKTGVSPSVYLLGLRSLVPGAA